MGCRVDTDIPPLANKLGILVAPFILPILVARNPGVCIIPAQLIRKIWPDVKGRNCMIFADSFRNSRPWLYWVCLAVAGIALDGRVLGQETGTVKFEYRVLATTKTSTMQKEMNEASGAGFRFSGVMGGETAVGGSEVTVVMSREPGAERSAGYEYKLLATSKTSTMQKEIQEAADEGFEYRGQTVFSSAFGGREVIVILERDRSVHAASYEYKLLATSKTSTMQRELLEAGQAGFGYVGVTVAETALGGKELVVIVRRPRQ